MKNKKQLLVQIRKLQGELEKLETVQDQKRAKKLVGKCFYAAAEDIFQGDEEGKFDYAYYKVLHPNKNGLLYALSIFRADKGWHVEFLNLHPYSGIFDNELDTQDFEDELNAIKAQIAAL